MSAHSFTLSAPPKISPQLNIEARAQELGKAVRLRPEFQAFAAASQAANNDPTIQKLYQEIQGHQTALQWGTGSADEHQLALQSLVAEFEVLPLIQSFRETESDVRTLFQALDKVISAAVKVPFAANAKRSCCGG